VHGTCNKELDSKSGSITKQTRSILFIVREASARLCGSLDDTEYEGRRAKTKKRLLDQSWCPAEAASAPCFSPLHQSTCPRTLRGTSIEVIVVLPELLLAVRSEEVLLPSFGLHPTRLHSFLELVDAKCGDLHVFEEHSPKTSVPSRLRIHPHSPFYSFSVSFVG
jgi:hypothetical protein